MTVTKLLLAAKATVGVDPSYNNGDIGELSINQDGRLRVSSKPGFFDVVAGALTSLNSNVATDVTDASNVMVHIKNTGTAAMAAGVLQFEGSLDSTDGINGTWFNIQAVRSNANIIETNTGTLSIAAGAGNAVAWELSVNACRWFRLRVSTAVTANSIAFVTVVRGTYATEPVPAIQTHSVTGSGNFSVLPGNATNYNLTSAASTNAVTVKSSAGSLGELSVFNPSAAAVFVKLYNKASAPTVGTDTPTVTIPVAAGALVSLEFGQMGKRFSTGIALAITAAAAASDTAAVAAGIQVHGTYI